MVKLLTNIIVNLRAAGPAAVLVAWIIGITLLGCGARDATADRQSFGRNATSASHVRGSCPSRHPHQVITTVRGRATFL
jgi:hypothetical protein